MAVYPALPPHFQLRQVRGTSYLAIYAAPALLAWRFSVNGVNPGAWPCQHWRLDGGGDLAHHIGTDPLLRPTSLTRFPAFTFIDFASNWLLAIYGRIW